MKKKGVRPLRFLADENFSSYILDALRVYTVKEEHVFTALLNAGFSQGTEDEDWISEVGTWDPKPVILSGDGRILSNPGQLAALKSARLHFVLLAGSYVNLPFRDQMIKIWTLWRDVEGFLSEAKAPIVIKVGLSAVKVLSKVSDLKSKRPPARNTRQTGRGSP